MQTKLKICRPSIYFVDQKPLPSMGSTIYVNRKPSLEIDGLHISYFMFYIYVDHLHLLYSSL